MSVTFNDYNLPKFKSPQIRFILLKLVVRTAQ